MRAFFYRHWSTIAQVIFALALVYGLFCLAGCGSLRRTAYVGSGAGIGAAAGSLAGPAGAIGGAAIGGAVTSAVVEADATQDRVDDLQDRFYPAPANYTPPPSAPWWHFEWVPLWLWVALAVWLYLKWPRILDALTGKEPRGDALLRAIGLRTHRHAVKAKGTA